MGMQRMKRQLARISRQNAEILRRLKKRLAEQKNDRLSGPQTNDLEGGKGKGT